LPGERNPPSAAEEFAPPPQGESVLDASMMADLIESKKEIVSQPKQARRNLAHRAEKPRRGGQSLQ